MKFQKRKGIDPIIASLLLIAIAVAAGVIVYIYVNGLAGGLTSGGGQQTTERLQLQAYSFSVSPGSCACSGQVLQMSLLDSGSGSTTISAVYFDGVAQTISNPPTADAPLNSTQAFVISTSTTPASGTAGDINFGASPTNQTSYAVGDTGQLVITFASADTPTSGTSHTVKVVSTTGATFIMTVTAGKSG